MTNQVARAAVAARTAARRRALRSSASEYRAVESNTTIARLMARWSPAPQLATAAA